MFWLRDKGPNAPADTAHLGGHPIDTPKTASGGLRPPKRGPGLKKGKKASKGPKRPSTPGPPLGGRVKKNNIWPPGPFATDSFEEIPCRKLQAVGDFCYEFFRGGKKVLGGLKKALYAFVKTLERFVPNPHRISGVLTWKIPPELAYY